MMTMKEADALPIPDQYKNTPNIYRLARIICSSEHCDKIMATLPLILAASVKDNREKGESAVCSGSALASQP